MTISLRSKSMAAALMVAALMVLAPQAHAEDAPVRVIRVSGNGVVKAAPDRARVSVSVASRAATAGEATAANAKASKSVLERLRGMVKAPGEVSTAGYDLSAEYDYSRPEQGGARRPTPIGYLVTNRFSVTTDDLDAVGRLIDGAVEAGATQIDSIGFYLDDEEAARQKALTLAGTKARSEAATVAASLGVTLGEVLDASTTSSSGPTPVYARESKMMAMSDAPASTEMVPGSLQITASVTVTFAIR